VTLSTGRGPVEYQDFDHDKALGGRLYLKTDAVGSLTVGASAYRGGDYDRSAKYVITQSGTVDQEYTARRPSVEFSQARSLARAARCSSCCRTSNAARVHQRAAS